MAFSLTDFRIAEEIGRGGFATVYKARQKSLSREVAIKCLSPQHTQNAEEIGRFRREAEAMASLTHDNILAVYDYAFYGGSYYIVMEYVEGMSLDHALDRAVQRRAALLILEKVAGALDYAHTENIIHRDVKPANILLGRNGQVKLADFGLALFHKGIESHTSPASVLGTISYMAPEALVSPEGVDARVDVFSLGCLLYRVCSGAAPFAGDSFGEISLHLLNDEPAPLSGSGISRELAALTMRCLRKDREKRPAITEVHQALKEALHDGYHAAHEDLVAFVRNGSRTGPPTEGPGTTPPLVQRNVSPARAFPKKNLSTRLITGVLAGLFLLAAAGLLGFHFSTARKPLATVLPGLPQYQQNSAVGETEKNATPQTHAHDGPPPLAGPELTMNLAQLVLRGLKPDDTIYLNNKRFTSVRGEAGMELAPGHYRLAVQGKAGQSMVKELELLPYERQVVDISKERKPQ